MTASTTCAGAVVIDFSDVSDGNTCPEVITRTWTAEDGCSNSESYVQTITVIDLTAPTGNAPANVSIQCSGDIPAANIASVTGVIDNCTASPVVSFVGDASDGNTCPETITRTYSITDDCSNETLVIQQIVINDDTDPTVVCSVATETLFEADGTSCPDYTSTVTATDNCTSVVNMSQSPAVGSTLSIGSNTITITAIDDCGNTSTCEINVILEESLSIDNHQTVNYDVYPNPTQNTLNVDFGKTMNNASLKLYDSTGKLVLEMNAINNASIQIDISAFSKGIYQLMIMSNSDVTAYKISKM